MKIAIPTNNFISIADDIVNSVRIKIFYIEKNCITNEEFLESSFNNDIKETVLFLIKNSIATIMINEINNELEILLKENNINVVRSKDLLITNAITNYLKDSNLKESNYCCCP